VAPIRELPVGGLASLAQWGWKFSSSGGEPAWKTQSSPHQKKKKRERERERETVDSGKGQETAEYNLNLQDGSIAWNQNACIQTQLMKLSRVVHTYNPSTLEAEAGGFIF
jgi:hypothetical protein